MKKESRVNKIWLLLSKPNYIYIILAILLAVLMVQFAYKDKNLEPKDVIELSAFSAVVLESILRGVTNFIRKLASNKVEDPSKLTTDYDGLIRTYSKSKSKMIVGSETSILPVVFESWLYDKQVVIRDNPKHEYRLPEMVVRYYDQLFSAHNTSNIYNNVNIRVNDWAIDDNQFIIQSGRTNYYSSLVTNRAMDYEIEKGITVRQLYECGPFVHPIADSALSNHIGFNGFIESADGYLAFIYRGKDVSIGKKTWATSVGASLKVKYSLDRQQVFSEKGLENGIIKEIENELRIKRHQLCPIGTQFKKIILISAYRDLVEGGKPQLLFYAKSSLGKDEISGIFNAGNKDVKKKARRIKNIRDKKEVQMETDGSIIKWISKSELIEVTDVFPGKIDYNGTEMAMVPSAAACVQMLKDYLKRKIGDEENDNC